MKLVNLFYILTGFTLAITAVARETKRCTPTKALEVELGIDHRDSFHSPVFMDIYVCDTKTSHRYKLKKHKKRKVPLIIIICGGILKKEAYETFARGMVEKGYIIAVLDHPVQFGLSINNFATPVDISNALSYIEDAMIEYQEADEEYNLFSAVDLNKVVLLGHSFGFSTVLNAINEQCTPPFCQFGTKVPFHQGVILTAGFGGSLVMFQSISGESTSYFHDNLNNLDVPAGLFYGDKDKTVMFEFGREKENGLVGMFSRMMPTTVSVVIKGLDHFSIVEEFPEWHPDMNSTVSMVSSLPRSDQLVTVVHVLDKWIKDNISRKKATNNFCEALSRESKRSRVLKLRGVLKSTGEVSK
ncbi:hypothetical protein CTEN210_17754 [Chaetoceros tenuissimus]|uniref:1-alkyl-2-acetylglycerophosphocholine esterase n=1 Tax=Chaetoceros tenuissimus TaxID=426638 RepID=A0AAD3HFP1_9STRA|nr:hypothetical protein CTEN210_17754 [Chaetoceros tenuissimus]